MQEHITAIVGLFARLQCYVRVSCLSGMEAFDEKKVVWENGDNKAPPTGNS